MNRTSRSTAHFCFGVSRPAICQAFFRKLRHRAWPDHAENVGVDVDPRLTTVVSVPLHGLYWSYITPDTGSGGGLGSTMQAIGLFWNYVLFVLPASVIGGLVPGWIVGVVKRNRWYGRQ